MGTINAPTSTLEDQFPGEAWAKGVQGGGFVGLSEDGKIYSGLPNEGPLLEGSWKDATVQFSFGSQSEKGLSLLTSFSGSYHADQDQIQGRLSQKIKISADITIEYQGNLDFTRVLQ
jgi:hypothetical protein